MTKTCAKCELALSGRSKMYSVGAGDTTFHFDVALGLEIAKDHPSYVVPRWLLERLVLVNTFEEEHLDHVNMDDPILLGTVPPNMTEYCVQHPNTNTKDPDFTIFVGLDGSHRSARALRDNVELKGRILSIAETKRCLVAVETTQNKS